MDLRSLNTFIQVAELNSFTRAGEKLGYSQPTVSLQIKQLEQELGVQLFERIGHTVTLTDSGREALTYAQKICHMSNEMIQGTSNIKEPVGIVRLAMADSLCSPLLIQKFASFRKQHPYISLHITAAGTDEMFRLLDHNEVDVVCTLDSHIYSMNYIIANEEKIGAHFVCSAQNPLAAAPDISLEKLLQQPFILTEKGMSYRRMLDEHLARNSMEIQPIMEIGRADLICDLVAQNMCVSFLPDYVTENAVKAGHVVRLHVEDFRIDLWKQLLYHRDKWMSQQLEAVLHHLSGIVLAA
jgi:DNA-binding transcriptional LysR family regulator